jgi:site-specific DNA recombinase
VDHPKPVGIWIRVSTEDQALGDSPEYHEKRAHYYAEAKEWKVREVYHLEAVSGKSVMQHPEAQRMLEDVRSGHISALIFSKLARLARNTRELLEFAEIFRQHDSDLVSLQESIDTSTPAGRLFYTMIAAMAQWEREEITERVKASVPIRAKLGKPLGGQAPFGYQWDDRRLVPDPNEAPVRKLIYELFLEHRRKKTVARLLNEAGYRTRKGGNFSDTTIDRLLRDPTAKGVRRANYTQSLGDNKKWELKPESEWVLIKVEPVVSEELWDQCNAILEEQRKRRQRPARKTVHLFSGLIFCHCGQKMYVPSGSRKYTCYACRNKIDTEDMESLFHHQLRDFFLSDQDISSYLEKSDQVIKEKQALLENLQSTLKRTAQEMDKVYRAYIDDELTRQSFGSLYKPLEERFNQIQEELPDLQAEIDFMKIQYMSSDEVISEARDLYSGWPQLTEEEKRRIIESITEQITIDEDEVTINLSYLPPPQETATKGQHNLRGS